MKLLERYIQTYGNALCDDVLKVDAFLNHQIDPQLMMELAKDMQQHFQNKTITKIVTIETSGIAPSVFLGYLLHVPVVYLKKNTSKITGDDHYETTVHSFTKNRDYVVTCDKKYLHEHDRLLFVDDFLANGEACLGAIQIIQQAQAQLCGIAIVIEKAFQQGRKRIETLGYEVYAQARVASLSQQQISFVDEENNT